MLLTTSLQRATHSLGKLVFALPLLPNALVAFEVRMELKLAYLRYLAVACGARFVVVRVPTGVDLFPLALGHSDVLPESKRRSSKGLND